MMESLRSSPRQGVVIVVTVIALVATVVVWLQMRTAEQIMAAHGGGIVAYELAFTPGQADALLRSWGSVGQQAARRSLLIDFPFMVSYALLFAGVTLLISRTQEGWPAVAGRWLTLAAPLAALLDGIENLMLLSMLGRGGSIPSLPPVVAGVAASLKFSLLLLVIVYWLFSGGRWLVRLLTGQARTGRPTG